VPAIVAIFDVLDVFNVLDVQTGSAVLSIALGNDAQRSKSRRPHSF
jgi:hypothetical protein